MRHKPTDSQHSSGPLYRANRAVPCKLLTRVGDALVCSETLRGQGHPACAVEVRKGKVYQGLCCPFSRRAVEALISEDGRGHSATNIRRKTPGPRPPCIAVRE